MRFPTAVFPVLLLLVQGTVLAQLQQDVFEESKGVGKGRSRALALDAAKEDAVRTKVLDIMKDKDLKEVSEDRVGMQDVLRSSSQYVSGVEVTKATVEKAKKGEGKGAGGEEDAEIHEVEIRARVNVSKLARDFEKARRIAALRAFGDKVGILLHEEADLGGETPAACWDFMGAVGAERAFMMYKFRPLPMGVVREGFRKGVEEGRTLKEEAFKAEMVESLAGIGAHVRILGGVLLAPVEEEKDALGNVMKGYAASWWGEIHAGDRYRRERKVEGRREPGKGPVGRGATDEEAREAAFKAAGEDMAFTLAGLLADLLEEKEEEPAAKPREVTLAVSRMEQSVFRAVESAVHDVPGILEVKRLRVSKGLWIAILTTTLEPEPLRQALEEALSPHGLTLVEDTEEKIRFEGGE